MAFVTDSFRFFGYRVPCHSHSITFPSGPSRQLSSLRRDMRRSARQAFAQKSWSNLRTQFNAYFMFCLHFHLVPLPADLDTICLYTQFLSRSFVSPQAIRNYVNGVKFLHIITGHAYDFSNNRILQLVLKGIEKGLSHMPVRATPISPHILKAVARAISLHSPEDVTCLCASVLLFLLMARAGNVFYHMEHGKPRGLSRSHVVFSRHAILVTFTHTKTITFGSRVLQIPLLAVPDSLLCPVAIFRRMVQLTPAAPSQPLFVTFSGGQLAPLSKISFLAHFRSLLVRAGVSSPSAFSCHSFRRGGASWAFRVGVPGEIIQIYGDWASDCYKRYLDISLDTRFVLARAVRDSLL